MNCGTQAVPTPHNAGNAGLTGRFSYTSNAQVPKQFVPFVILKVKLQHERYGAGGAPTTDEPTRANAAGSNPTSKAQDAQTTASGGAVVTLNASGETAV